MTLKADDNELSRRELRLLARQAALYPVKADDREKALECVRKAMDSSKIRTNLTAVHVLAELDRLSQAERLVRLKELEADLDTDALAAVEAGLAELEQAKRRPPAIPAVQSPSQD